MTVPQLRKGSVMFETVVCRQRGSWLGIDSWNKAEKTETKKSVFSEHNNDVETLSLNFFKYVNVTNHKRK